MFFGVVVKPSQSFKLQPSEGEVLHLSGACLKSPVSSARCFLVVAQDGKEHVICALKKDTMENVPLDLFLATRDGVEFKAQGEHEIHLFGYYEPTEGESDEDNDSEDECDEKELMSAAQKAFQAREAAKGADEEDDDDSDADDDEELGDAQEGLEDGGDDDDDDDEDDDDEEDEKVASLLKQLAEQEAKKKEKKQAKQVEAKQVEAVETTRTEKKRKAVETPAKGKPAKQMKSEDSSAATQFEKSVVEYLKKHGRTQVSQVASACPKPAAITSKYREFLSTRSSFNLDGNFVSLKQ